MMQVKILPRLASVAAICAELLPIYCDWTFKPQLGKVRYGFVRNLLSGYKTGLKNREARIGRSLISVAPDPEQGVLGAAHGAWDLLWEGGYS